MATAEEIIAEEWRERATELADWAIKNLVNRKDVWGQYAVLTPSERKSTSAGSSKAKNPSSDRQARRCRPRHAGQADSALRQPPFA